MEDKEPTASECPHDGDHITEWNDLSICDLTFKDGTPGEQRIVPIRCNECGKKGFWIGLCDKQNKYRRCVAVYLTEQEHKALISYGGIMLKKLLEAARTDHR